MSFKKITYETWETHNQNEMFDMLPDSVKEMIEMEMINHMIGYMEDVTDCESPIEMMMSLALNILWKNRDISIVSIEKQANVICSNKKYRVDFLIVASKPRSKKTYNFVIECDGHEFHQKTKQQVEKDNTRNRDLSLNGYIVTRFSGSEIYKNSYKCAKEIFDIIESCIKNGG